MNTNHPSETVDETNLASISNNDLLSKDFAGNANVCHVIGAIVSTCLLAAIFWVSQNSQTLSSDNQHTPSQIDEAKQLIAQAERIETAHQDLLVRFRKCEQQFSLIKNWLPATTNWNQQKNDLRDLSDASGTTWISADQDASSIGKRVRVIHVTCRVRGSFEQICCYLNKIADAKHPIWCSGIVIDRIDGDEKPSQLSGQTTDQCEATLTLRLPCGAASEMANELLRAEPSNAT